MLNNADTEARVVSMKPRRATKSACERMDARFFGAQTRSGDGEWR